MVSLKTSAPKEDHFFMNIMLMKTNDPKNNMKDVHHRGLKC